MLQIRSAALAEAPICWEPASVQFSDLESWRRQQRLRWYHQSPGRRRRSVLRHALDNGTKLDTVAAGCRVTVAGRMAPPPTEVARWGGRSLGPRRLPAAIGRRPAARHARAARRATSAATACDGPGRRAVRSWRVEGCGRPGASMVACHARSAVRARADIGPSHGSRQYAGLLRRLSLSQRRSDRLQLVRPGGQDGPPSVRSADVGVVSEAAWSWMYARYHGFERGGKEVLGVGDWCGRRRCRQAHVRAATARQCISAGLSLSELGGRGGRRRDLGVADVLLGQPGRPRTSGDAGEGEACWSCRRLASMAWKRASSDPRTAALPTPSIWRQRLGLLGRTRSRSAGVGGRSRRPDAARASTG